MAEAHEAVAFSFTVGHEGKTFPILFRTLLFIFFLQALMSMSVTMYSRHLSMLVYAHGNFVVDEH